MTNLFGGALAILCLVHCALVPALLYFLNANSSWFQGEWIHTGLVLAAIGISGPCLILGGTRKSRWLGNLGFIFLIGSLTSSQPLLAFNDVIAILGSIFMLLGHAIHHRECRLCPQHQRSIGNPGNPGNPWRKPATGEVISMGSRQIFLMCPGLPTKPRLSNRIRAYSPAYEAVPLSTVREYFQILQDTLLGTMLPAYSKNCGFLRW